MQATITAAFPKTGNPLNVINSDAITLRFIWHLFQHELLMEFARLVLESLNCQGSLHIGNPLAE